MRKVFYFLVPVCVMLMILSVSTVVAQDVIYTQDFETSLGDWVAGGEGSSTEMSTEQALSGTNSMKLVKPATGLEINLQNDVYEDFQEGDIVTFHIWISASDLAAVNGAQVFWQNTDSWNWNSQWTNGSDLTGDAWNTVTYTFPAFDLPFQRIGFQLLLQAGNEALTPALYVDDITVSRPAAAQFIVVDGEKDDFYNTLTGPDDGYLQLKYYASNDNGTNTPYNNEDLSAQIWAAWDSTWFYFYTEVMDDSIAGDGANSYQSDGLELKIDPKATSITNTIVAPNLTILDTSTAGVVGWDNLNSIPDSLKMYAKRITSNGYALELALNWDAIVSGSESVSANVDSVFGLAINIHDNDIAHTREGSVMWAARMVDAVWNTPGYLGTVKFLADNKLQFIPTNNITGETNPVPFDGTPFFINVDAQKDPVYRALLGPDDGYLRIRSFSNSDNGAPVNDADLSSMIWANWDDEWLYLYEEVRDDTVSANAANDYLVDCLELKFDPQATDSTNTGTSIYGINLTALDSSTAGVTVFNNLTGIPDSMKQWSRRTISGGYALELALKWPVITANSENVSVGEDNVFGLGINNHDNDGNGRQASITWAAVVLDHIWDTPKYLGTVKFLADNKLQFIPTNNMTGVTNPIPYDGSDWVDVEVENSSIPDAYSLKQNYPNPFNPATTISYTIPSVSKVHLTIFDILGREIAELVNEEQEPGEYKVRFDANNLASGIYFYRIEAGSFINTQKMMLLK